MKKHSTKKDCTAFVSLGHSQRATTLMAERRDDTKKYMRKVRKEKKKKKKKVSQLKWSSLILLP